MDTTSPVQRYSLCTGLACAGVEISGHVQRCPACGSSLVTHHTRRAPMSTAELEARAIQRAKDEHVHIRRTARPGVYTTCSKSEPGTTYTLVARDGIEACSCRGYEYRQSCKHVEALRMRLAREARRAGSTVDLAAVIDVPTLYAEAAS